MGKALQAWHANRGIVHELTTAYSPEWNAKAGRLNQTFLDMSRSAMLGARKNLPVTLWTENILYANYVRNRLKTKSCKDDTTAFEIIHGYKTAYRKHMYLILRPSYTFQGSSDMETLPHVPRKVYLSV